MQDSLIGYAVATLYNPGGTSDSLIGYATVMISDPPDTGASLIGFATKTVRDPHRPIVIQTPSGPQDFPIRIYDGSTWI